tara:strand:+ start:287 stop:436 length:150 start_codon:yes stop_codon:yes gene_type:complete
MQVTKNIIKNFTTDKGLFVGLNNELNKARPDHKLANLYKAEIKARGLKA